VRLDPTSRCEDRFGVKTSKAQSEKSFRFAPESGLSICAFLEAIFIGRDASRDAGASSWRRVTTAADAGASAVEASPARASGARRYKLCPFYKGFLHNREKYPFHGHFLHRFI
jgi:hypothetical protein